MKVLYTGRGFEPSATIKESIEEKLLKIKKYLGDLTEAHVIFSVEKYRHGAEIILQGRSFSLTCSEETEDMLSSVQKMMDKLERQARKHRTKIIDRKRKKPQKAGAVPVVPEGLEEVPEQEPGEKVPGNVIRVDGYDVKPMPLEEAVMQMEISERDFLVFRESETDKVNVLFWRKDGNLGLIAIEP